MSERTDADILSKKPVEIVFGERTFSVVPQSIRASSAFRDLVDNQEETDPAKQLDLVYKYSPELAENREYIEDNGTDSQLVEAFVQVMELAYGPFAKELPEKLSRLFGGAVKAEIDKIMADVQSPTKSQ